MSTLQDLKPYIITGGKIRRKCWSNKDLYIRLSQHYELVFPSGQVVDFGFAWIVADDWEIFETEE